ncbi:MAG: helix-turn-helix domain-containing protein [Synechococcus sp.]
MAPARLSDSQKQELVSQFKAGVTAAALAEAFGCSPNTVSRTVKALLSPQEYDSLKQKRSGRGAAAAAAKEDEPKPEAAVKTEVAPEAPSPEAELEADEPLEGSSSLALDDADDFGADDSDEELDELSDDDSAVETFVAIAPLPGLGVIDSGAPCVSKPLVDGSLPSTVYLLVDREVELKGTPVKDFSELGAVAATEMEQQAIALFSNPRQAKRQCGRSQRVIKVPDSGVFGRTAPFILAQGISRIVLEGSLYAIPGA